MLIVCGDGNAIFSKTCFHFAKNCHHLAKDSFCHTAREPSQWHCYANACAARRPYRTHAGRHASNTVSLDTWQRYWARYKLQDKHSANLCLGRRPHQRSMDDVEEIEHALTRWTKYGIDLPRTARLELCTVSLTVMCNGLLTEAAFQKHLWCRVYCVDCSTWGLPPSCQATLYSSKATMVTNSTSFWAAQLTCWLLRRTNLDRCISWANT